MPQRTHRYWSRASTKSLTCWDGLDLPISVFVLGLAPRVRRLLILLLRLLESLLRLLESLLILLLRLLETRLLGLGFRAQHRNGAGRDIPILIPFPILFRHSFGQAAVHKNLHAHVRLGLQLANLIQSILRLIRQGTHTIELRLLVNPLVRVLIRVTRMDADVENTGILKILDLSRISGKLDAWFSGHYAFLL